MKSWEVLFTRGDAEGIRMAGVKRMRTRTIKAGDVLECEIYPVWNTQGKLGARKAAGQTTRQAQLKVNHRNAVKKLTRLLNTNFGREDLHVTLTYKGTAPDHTQATRDMQNYIKRIKRLRAKRGLEPMKYIYVLEWEDEPGRQKRIHFHLVMNGGLPREMIEEAWLRGYANCDRLQPNEEGLAQLAKYLSKGPKGARKWVGSRNLKKPVITTSDHKISMRRARRAAEEMETEGKMVFEKVYPGYQFVNCQVFYPSMEFVDGVYLCATMIKRRD